MVWETALVLATDVVLATVVVAEALALALALVLVLVLHKMTDKLQHRMQKLM